MTVGNILADNADARAIARYFGVEPSEAFCQGYAKAVRNFIWRVVEGARVKWRDKEGEPLREILEHLASGPVEVADVLLADQKRELHFGIRKRCWIFFKTLGSFFHITGASILLSKFPPKSPERISGSARNRAQRSLGWSRKSSVGRPIGRLKIISATWFNWRHLQALIFQRPLTSSKGSAMRFHWPLWMCENG
jgi:hypothetical protein